MHPTSYAQQRAGDNYQKTAALLTTLYTMLPRKRFYLKLDVDAMLRPANLLRFLSFLDREVHPESPVYFGAAFGTFACDVDERDVCRAFSHNKGVPSEAQVMALIN